jgi:thiol-disulfide isomerase/thioredoxin
MDQMKKDVLNETDITIVMATWCSDSQREVPRFIKIMDSVGHDPSNITIINVDRKKMAEKTPVDKLKIERIPTFIFSKNGKELGRIVESPKESLEKDMVNIIGG